MRNIRIVQTLCFLFITLGLAAQSLKNVTGSVTDTNGDPLIGATIKGEKSDRGTVTDLNGKFTLQVRPEEKTITISYIGYNTKIVSIGKGQNIKIQLSEQYNELDQLVVIGYGAVKKGSVTASVSSVKGEESQKAVANERRYELAGEGVRWHDLVRQNCYVETLRNMFINDDTTSDQSYASLATRVTKDSYLYPIPLQQIQVLEGLYEQNPGYE